MKKKILYVEDEKDIAATVRDILVGNGYDVKLAHSGKSGLEMGKGKFDLILLDIMLPDMSGWDIFSKLKKKGKSKFAFISAIPVSDERLEELKEAGVSDYITKPLELEDFTKRIKDILKPGIMGMVLGGKEK